MNARPAVSIFALGLALTSCGGDGDDVELADEAPMDTAAMGMPPGGMRGGMGPMAGAGPGMMMGDWEAHMAAMHGASGDSLRAMMGRHRQMASGMMAMMDSTQGGMGLPMDSAWLSTRDSLRMDLDRMQGMSPEEMEAFLQTHDARMRRMLQMHQSATGGRQP
jgi:hypothetical protein